MPQVYESWASGVLDLIKSPREAVALLTLVPKKRNASGGGNLYLWYDSVMDQARQTLDPNTNTSILSPAP